MTLVRAKADIFCHPVSGHGTIAERGIYASRQCSFHHYDGILRGMADPEGLDELAFRDQSAWVEKNGGRDKISAEGAIQGSPVPGEKAEYVA